MSINPSLLKQEFGSLGTEWYSRIFQISGQTTNEIFEQWPRDKTSELFNYKS